MRQRPSASRITLGPPIRRMRLSSSSGPASAGSGRGFQLTPSRDSATSTLQPIGASASCV
ncbi:hypothetical protein D3C83_287650 [compost metagenome]